MNGGNAISWEQKFEYDVWYVDHVTFLLDIKILLKAIYNVFKREGISSDTSATMEEFKWNLKWLRETLLQVTRKQKPVNS